MEDTYAITISMDRYLDVNCERQVRGHRCGEGDPRQSVLLGGDANDDDAIGLGDATIIGGQYGNSGSGITNPGPTSMPITWWTSLTS